MRYSVPLDACVQCRVEIGCTYFSILEWSDGLDPGCCKERLVLQCVTKRPPNIRPHRGSVSARPCERDPFQDRNETGRPVK